MKVGSRVLAAAFFAAAALAGIPSQAAPGALSLDGVAVAPHLMLDTMRYTKAPEPADGARVQLFLRNASKEVLTMDAAARLLFDGKAPGALLESGDWAWHDTPAASQVGTLVLAPDTMTVWTFNGRRKPFGPGGTCKVELGPEDAPWLAQDLEIAAPKQWISAITFLGPEADVRPDTLVVHVANDAASPLELRGCRLWLPLDPKNPRVLAAQPPLAEITPFNGHKSIPAKDRGGFTAKPGPLPLTYAVVEVTVASGGKELSLWGHLRVRKEVFDISGGWVGSDDALKSEAFHKALKRFYVNTAHMAASPGYTDTEMYAKYPLKYFNCLEPAQYDTDELLPRIHAVECLGEPQYGGGRPVPPQEVWEKLYPYAATRLATTLTNSEERVWRDYAGLSDFTHYDAYRVTAPSCDAWWKYDRWTGGKIYWGSPLETITDMCISLREMTRPMPCAYWSQGPHEGWGRYGGRKRTSPTPEELRLQAHHALSTRITSLYWFNLSLKTLVKWRDTLDELGRVGREMRMMDDFLLEGDAYRHERVLKADGKPDWDLNSVACPRGALLFALDLDYDADREVRVFKFGAPRAAVFSFPLPAYLGAPADVFRMDADGVHDVSWTAKDGGVEISDTRSLVGIYVAAPDKELRGRMAAEHQELLASEAALNFDPARNDADFAELENYLGGK